RATVRVGDVAVIDAEPVELPNGRLGSRALDNRLGSYIALEAARLVAAAGGHPLGSGAVIGRGSVLNPGVFELLHDTAEAEKIPFTVEASGRHTGTDADAVHLARG